MQTACDRHGGATVVWVCDCDDDGRDEHGDPCECGCPVCRTVVSLREEAKRYREAMKGKAVIVQKEVVCVAHLEAQDKPISYVEINNGSALYLMGAPGMRTLRIMNGSIGGPPGPQPPFPSLEIEVPDDT